MATRLCGETDADLAGWPVSLRLLGGHVPHARVAVRDARPPRTDVVLTSLELDADGIRLDGMSLASVDAVRFEATMDADGLSEAVDLPATVSSVELRDGDVLLRTPVGLSVPATVTVADRALVIRPRPALLDRLAFRIPLHDLPLEIATVEVVPGFLTATGTVDPDQLTAAPARPCPVS